MSCAGLGRTRGRHTLARKLYESPHHRFPAGRGASTKHPRGWRSHPHQVSRTTHPTLRTLCRCVRLELDTEGPKSGVTPRRGDEDRQDGWTYRARLTLLPLAGAMRTWIRRSWGPGRSVVTPRRGDEDAYQSPNWGVKSWCYPSQGRWGTRDPGG